MGYIRRDFTAPTIAKWQYSLKFKNTILRHWPTTTIDGVKVFDRLYLYQNGVGVLKTPSHLKIYKLLGMKVADLEKGPYDGIENTYMYVPGVDLSYSILTTQIQSYVELNSPQIYPLSKDPFNVDPVADTRLNPDIFKDNPEWEYDINGEAIDSLIPEPQWDKDGWITTYLTYNPPVKADVPETIGDAQILALIEAGDRTNIHFDDEEDHPLTFASILDTENILFENKVRIVQKTIEERTTHTYTLNRGNLSSNGTAVGRYLKTAVVEYKFRRVKDASDPLVATLLTKIETEMEALSVNLNRKISPRIRNLIRQSNTFGASLESSVSKQLIRMYHDRVGHAAGTLNYNGRLMYDAMVTLKAKDFGKVFSKQIKQGYTLKKVKWYKKLLVIVIDIIVIVVCIILIYFGQAWAIPLVMSLGAMAQGQLAAYWMRNGDYAAANYAMGHAEYLQLGAQISSFILSPGLFLAMEGLKAIAANSKTGAQIVGALLIIGTIYAIYSGMSTDTAAKEAGRKASEETAKAGGDKVAQELARKVADELVRKGAEIATYSLTELSNMSMEQLGDVTLDSVTKVLSGGIVSTSNMLVAGIQLINMSFNYYMTVIDPPPSMDAKQKELADSEKLLEDTAGPETLDTIEVEYSDPYSNWIDMNEKMQSIPLMMTQGKNKLLMNKYYNSRY